MLIKKSLSKTLKSVSIFAMVFSLFTTSSWAMEADETGTPAHTFMSLPKEVQVMCCPREALKEIALVSKHFYGLSRDWNFPRTHVISSPAEVKDLGNLTKSQIDQKYPLITTVRVKLPVDLKLEETDLKYLFDFIDVLFKDHSQPMTLDLSNSNINEEDVTLLANILETNTSLTHLNLSGNLIGERGAVALFTALKSNNSLSKLIMAHNCIGDEAAEVLSDTLKTNTSLSHLDLKTTDIGSSGAAALFSALETNHFLSTLILCNNPIWQDGEAFKENLGTALRQSTSLTSLDLSETSIGDEEVTALSTALAKNSSLKSLNLSKINISQTGIEALCSALESTTTPRSLNLSINVLGEPALARIATALQNNVPLISLTLDHNVVFDADAIRLAAALETNTSLTELSLKGHEFLDEEGKEALRAAFESRKNGKLLLD